MVVVTLWVFVTEEVGTERQEHAEDSNGAARCASAVGTGILIALPARLTGSTVGTVLSVVVDVTVVVVVVLLHSVS
jgi:hypothetical protein